MIRMVELANFLVNAGYTVAVIALERETEYPNLLKLDDRVKTYYVRDSVLSDSGAKSRTLVKRLHRKLRRDYVRKFAIDPEQPALSRYRATIKSVVRMHSVKTIVLSSPPCSLRLLSVWLKRRYGRDIFVVADYRDSWTLRNMNVQQLSLRQLKRSRRLEQRTLRSNDLTVFVSAGMKRQYENAFSVGQAIIVENGYVDRAQNDIESKFTNERIESWRSSGCILLGYFGKGSVIGDGHKDFRLLLDILCNHSQIAERTALLIAGRISGIDEYRQKLLVAEFGIVSNVFARELMHLVDVALVVHSEELEAPSVMGGKLYEYIAASKPIWFLVPQNADSIQEFVHKHGKGYISDVFSEESIYAGLIRILKDKDEGRLHEQALSAQEAREYRRDVQYARLLPYIGSPEESGL